MDSASCPHGAQRGVFGPWPMCSWFILPGEWCAQGHSAAGRMLLREDSSLLLHSAQMVATFSLRDSRHMLDKAFSLLLGVTDWELQLKWWNRSFWDIYWFTETTGRIHFQRAHAVGCVVCRMSSGGVWLRLYVFWSGLSPDNSEERSCCGQVRSVECPAHLPITRWMARWRNRDGRHPQMLENYMFRRRQEYWLKV